MKLSSRVGVGLVGCAVIAAGQGLAVAPTAGAAETESYPIYTVERVGLTKSELGELTERLGPVMGKGDFIEAADASLHFFSPSSMSAGYTISETPPATASDSQDDEKGAPLPRASWDTAYLAKAPLVSPKRAERLLLNAVASLDLGDEKVDASASSTELEIYNPSQDLVQFSGSTGTTVGRLSQLSGAPLVGPGQSLDLYFGADGKVAYANVNVRKVKQSKRAMRVPVGSAAAKACATALGSVKGAEYSGIPVYYLAAGAKKGASVFPALSCSTVGIPDVVAQEMIVDVRDLRRPVAADLGTALIEQIPTDEGLAEFGSAYLGDNASGPLNNACNGPCPSGWVARDFSQENVDPFDASMLGGGFTQLIDGVDFVSPGMFVGGLGAQANAVDLMYYTGHASANTWQANTTNNPASRTSVNVDDVRLGQVDLEWLVIAACGPLQATDGAGTIWRDRLTPMFQGLHALMAYATVSNVSVIEGQRFADYAQGALTPPGLGETDLRGWRFPITWAWQFAAIDAQPTQTRARPATATTRAVPAVTIQGAIMGTSASDGTGGTAMDCLACFSPDQYPGRGDSVWRLAFGT